METTRKRRMVRMIALLPVFFIVFAGLIWVVFGLWNWLMPSIFGLKTITYWQALGLMALSWILFRGSRGPRFGRGPWRHGMRRAVEKDDSRRAGGFHEGLAQPMGRDAAAGARSKAVNRRVLSLKGLFLGPGRSARSLPSGCEGGGSRCGRRRAVVGIRRAVEPATGRAAAGVDRETGAAVLPRRPKKVGG